MNRMRWGLLGLALALLIVLSGITGHSLGSGSGEQTGETVAGTEQDTPFQDFGVLNEIYQVLDEHFVDPHLIEPEFIQSGAINGIIDWIGNPHMVYIDPESYALGTDIISGTFQGIGAHVDQDPVTRAIVIVAPFSGSPAEAAGIRPGDVILAVNGESTEGWSTTQAVQRIRGPEGEPVHLTIRHRNGDVEDITVIRATVTIPTVFVKEIRDADGKIQSDIAYIELQQFTEKTVVDLEEQLRIIEQAGYDALILDVRRNPGGALSATVDVTDMFLEDGRVLTKQDRDNIRATFDARPGGTATEIPLVVLIGPGSASGAEVLAGALRDNNRATLIGETTFGKGDINQLFELSNGGAIYVTIAHWFTPSGEQVEGVGLSPDLEVTPSDDDLDERRDVQLFAAIEFLRDNFLEAEP